MQLFQWGPFFKEEFAPRGANSFLEEVTLLRRKAKKWRYRIASSQSIPTHNVPLGFIKNMLAVALYNTPTPFIKTTPGHLIGLIWYTIKILSIGNGRSE